MCVHQLLTLVRSGCLWLGEPIPITDMLIHRITRLLYQGVDRAEEFAIERMEKKLMDRMKNNFGLIKKSRGYSIPFITDMAVLLFAQILAYKVTRKCCMDEVLVPFISLATYCMKGVQYNSTHYLYKEFLINFCESHDDVKAFHYA